MCCYDEHKKKCHLCIITDILFNKKSKNKYWDGLQWLICNFVCVVVQIANSNPLVSDRQDLSVLQSEYAEDDTVYQLKIKVSQSAAPLRLLQPHVNPKFLCLNSQ